MSDGITERGSYVFKKEKGVFVHKEEVETTTKTGGKRFNGEKLRLSLVPRELRDGVAEVMWRSAEESGHGKYEMHNWKKGLHWTETAESAMRHIDSFVHRTHEGDLDIDSGLHHLKHAATNIAFLLHFIEKERYKELDDRYKEEEDE